MNAWRAPQRVVAADCPDQIPDVDRDRRPADTTARLATPVQTEAAPMPAHQRLRLEDNRGFKQGGEQPLEPDGCRRRPLRTRQPSQARVLQLTSTFTRLSVEPRHARPLSMCPPNTDVTISAIYKCHLGSGGGRARSPRRSAAPLIAKASFQDRIESIHYRIEHDRLSILAVWREEAATQHSEYKYSRFASSQRGWHLAEAQDVSDVRAIEKLEGRRT